MKEASGELSMTAVAVVAIAAVGVLFTTVIWPNIKNSLKRNQMCANAVGCICDGATCDCTYYKDENDKTGTPVVCDNPEKTKTKK